MNKIKRKHREAYIFIDVLMVAVSAFLSAYFTKFSIKENFNMIIYFAVFEAVCVVFVYASLRLYRSLWKYASVNELVKIAIGSSIIALINVIVAIVTGKEYFDIGFCLVNSLLIFVGSGFTRFVTRIIGLFKRGSLRRLSISYPVMIIGAGDAGSVITRELLYSDKTDKTPVCIIDDDRSKHKGTIYDVPIVGDRNTIIDNVEKYGVKEIILALPSISAKEKKELLDICKETKCKVSSLPGIYELANGTVSVSKIRDVEIKDLLGREQIKVNLDEIMGYIEGKVVLVTGGGGSIGSELCRQIATHNPKQLIILDIYENNAYDIEQELKRKLPNLNLVTLIASVRDIGKLEDVFKTYKPNIVFNAAAHKHVPLMETSPNEAIKNNVFGTLNVAKCADKYGSSRFVQISTDKAVNPTNIMGASKRICEMIIQAIGKKSKSCRFVAVRFGNVLGSNGSVIPLFKKQIAEGGPVTVTHKDIIRYFMTIPEAVSLVLQAGAYAKSGEIYVLDMGEPVRIYDLATNLIKLSGYTPGVDMEIKITGLRPGEKLYEERLMSEEGLEKTANGLISVAKPLDFDEDKLFDDLDLLYKEAYNETKEMKYLVSKLVETYKVDENQ